MLQPGRIRAVLFDAVGTLITPHPPVAEAYQAAGARFGSGLSVWGIARRFRAALATSSVGDDVLRRTNSKLEKERWKRIVATVFSDLDAGATGELFTVLWDHFADPANWRLVPGAEAAWQALTARKLRLGIASNFDERLREVCVGLPPLNGCANVFISSEVGYSKPSPVFFQMVQNHLELACDQILLIGDDLENDYEAARAAGWQALLFDPHGTHDVPGSLAKLADVAERVK